MASFIKNKGWKWIPSLYFAEGLPYILVMSVALIMYKNLELSNTQITLYTGWLYLPWLIKPLWSPFIDIIKTKRWWIITTQILLGGGMAGIAFSLQTPLHISMSLAFLWLMAFSSATHDIAADGIYMYGLKEHEQSLFVGIRSIFYRLAVWFGQGLVVMSAGLLHRYTDIKDAWSYCFIALAVLFLILAQIHKRSLPRPESESSGKNSRQIFTELKEAFITFFTKRNIGIIILFIFFYRFGEAQLGKIAPLFMLDPVEKGGLGLSTEMIGFIYGTIGVIALILGGILGGVVISQKGLRFWIWPMALAMKLPDFVYVLLSTSQPDNLYLIASSVAIEQFGYGFGFTAFMMYLIMVAESKYKTTHYAFATGIMAAGMMIPGMISGWIQDHFGYIQFFIWVMICTVPGLLLIPFLKIPKGFGRKNS